MLGFDVSGSVLRAAYKLVLVRTIVKQGESVQAF